MYKFTVEEIENDSKKAAEEIINIMKSFNLRSELYKNGIFKHLTNDYNEIINAKNKASESGIIDGFKFWSLVVEKDPMQGNAIRTLGNIYNKKVQNNNQIGLSYKKLASSFLVNESISKEESEYDKFYNNIKSCLADSLKQMCNENKNALDKLCIFFERLNEIKKERKKENIDKNNKTLNFVNELISSIEKSGKMSSRNSGISGEMYKKLMDFSETLKKGNEEGNEVSGDTLNSLKETAESYIAYKLKNGYNQKAFGKIAAADGIINLINAYKEDDVEKIVALKMKKAEDVMQYAKSNVQEYGSSKKTTYTNFLEKEINKAETKRNKEQALKEKASVEKETEKNEQKFTAESMYLNPRNVAKDIMAMMKYFHISNEERSNPIFAKNLNINKEQLNKFLEKSDLEIIHGKINGFKFWKQVFAENDKYVKFLDEFNKKYDESLAKSKSISENKTFSTNFLVDAPIIAKVHGSLDEDFNKKFNEDFNINVENILTETLKNVNKNVNLTNDFCEFFNNINAVVEKRKEVINVKNKKSSEFVSKLLESIAESGDKSFRNSGLSGEMYTGLIDLSDKLKTGYEVSEKDLNSLNVIADVYLNHKAKDGYNSNAYGKILAADGIKKFVEAYKNDSIEEIDNLQISDMKFAKESVKKIIDDERNELKTKNNNELSSEQKAKYKEKVTFNKLLKDEIGKTAKKTKAVSTEMNSTIEKGM